MWLRTLPAAEFVAEDYLGNQYYEDKEEAARSYSPKRGRFVVYAAVVQPPSRLLPSVNRADPGSQIPTEWCAAGAASPSVLQLEVRFVRVGDMGCGAAIALWSYMTENCTAQAQLWWWLRQQSHSRQ